MANVETQSDKHLLLATFWMGSALFGIDAQQVQEVVRVGDITQVHHAPAFVAGIRNLRGRIITVIDLRMRVDLGSVSITPDTRILIVDWQNEPIGLLVDRISDIIDTDHADIVPPPPNVYHSQAQYLLGVCRSGDHLVALLNPLMVLRLDRDEDQRPIHDQVVS